LSPQLGRFFQDNNETATHFVIGVNILEYPTQFQFLFDTLNHDIAVHTYTHPYMTKLTNLDIVAQLGWSMQLIHDSTGGRLPRYWRPPYGDADNRVRAIAKEVFGLRTIFWNQEWVARPYFFRSLIDRHPDTIALATGDWVKGPVQQPT
jgi:chitin deacetylase